MSGSHKGILRITDSFQAIVMTKNSIRSARCPSDSMQHEQQLDILPSHHERIMNDPALHEAMLVGSGIFRRNSDGKLVVAKPYEKVIFPKLPA